LKSIFKFEMQAFVGFMQYADYSIKPTLLNKKSFNGFYFTSAKYVGLVFLIGG